MPDSIGVVIGVQSCFMMALFAGAFATLGVRAASNAELRVASLAVACTMFVGSTPNSTESSTATPSVPPIWRKKVAAPVATPIWFAWTELWLARVRVCISWPRPRPMQNIAIMVNQSGLSMVRKVSNRKPTPVMSVPVTGKMRYLPVREMIWPDPIEASRSPAIKGSVAKPDAVGLSPKTICRYSGRVSRAPNMPNPTSTPRTVAIENTRERKRRSGMIASSFISVSATRKPIRPRPPIT